MSARDGGPAFPHVGSDERVGVWTDQPGLSIRDYFAAHAVLTPSDIEYANRQYPNGVASVLAGIRYQYADAMLVARGSAGPELEAEREAKIEAWLERDKLREVLVDAERLLREVAKQKGSYPNWAKAYEAAADRAAEVLAPKTLSPQLGDADPGPAAGRGPDLPAVSPTPGLSPAGGSEDGRPVEGPDGSSARKEQA
jgi:hypothetical protein